MSEAADLQRVLGPPSSDPAAWRWRGAWWVEGQGNWSPLWALGGKNYVRRDAEPRRAHHTHSPTRHPLLAVSGAPTAQRVPALDVMGPAPQRMTAESTSERSSGRGTARKLRVGPLTVSSAHGKASACGHGSSRGQVRLWSWSLEGLEAWPVSLRGKLGSEGGRLGTGLPSLREQGLHPWGWRRRVMSRLLEGGGSGIQAGYYPVPPPPPPGETRRILSVQPTYDWTCFSHSLLNVSPMPVESSPPLPCPTPCHLLPNCTSCLASKGADGGWQHCVWSSSLQQVMPVSCCQPWRPPAPALLSFLLPLAISSFPPAVVVTTLSLPPDVSPVFF